MLREIADGNLPVVAVPGLGLQKRETPHWVEPAVLLEERVLRREYVGGSHGLSVRIAKGVTYRVGAQRGQLVSTTGIVPVSRGTLVVTNKRVVFRGDAKGFSVRLEKLLDAELFNNGMRVMDGSGKPRLVQLTSPRDIEILGAIMSQVISNTNA